jgi:hypothetical protein
MLRSCGGFKHGSQRYKIEIARGRVSCREARKVLKAFLNGKGKKHGGGSEATTYWTVYGWRCGYGTGIACTRGGTRRKARDVIGAAYA